MSDKTKLTAEELLYELSTKASTSFVGNGFGWEFRKMFPHIRFQTNGVREGDFYGTCLDVMWVDETEEVDE